MLTTCSLVYNPSAGRVRACVCTCSRSCEACVLAVAFPFGFLSSFLPLTCSGVCSRQVWSQLCDGPCLCPTSAPRCPPGVPLVPDGCRCCPVCARQLGEPCDRRFPCDAQRGLRCDDSASFPGEPGRCVGERFRSGWAGQDGFKVWEAETFLFLGLVLTLL